MGMGTSLQAAVAAASVAIGTTAQPTDQNFREVTAPSRESSYSIRDIAPAGATLDGVMQVGVGAGPDKPGDWMWGKLGLAAQPSQTASSATALKLGMLYTALDRDGPMTPEIQQLFHNTLHSRFAGNLTATTDKLETLSKQLMTPHGLREFPDSPIKHLIA